MNSDARLFGFASEAERQDYIKENPNLYAVMGGYKCEPSLLKENYTNISDENKKVIEEAQRRDSYLPYQYRLDRNDVFRAQEKRFKGISLTDREIEAEARVKWFDGSISSEDIPKSVEKAKAVNNALTKFNNGEEISLSERLILTENGGRNVTGGNTYKTIDFLAKDNPKNVSAFNDYKKAVEKEKKGQELTDDEKADISNFEAYNAIKRSIVKDNFTMGSVILRKTLKNLILWLLLICITMQFIKLV